jgi:hypothetical protein
MIYTWLLVALGALVFIDGLGSVLVEGGQFHDMLFDGERYFRAAMGILIILFSILAR